MADVRALVRRVSTAIETTYCCPFCMVVERVRKGQAGTGRGHGLSASSTARAKIITHIRAVHAERIASIKPKRITPKRITPKRITQ